MASRQDRLRVSAAVLGAVAVLAVVGRISPEEPASQPRPTLATMRAPPQGSVRPNRWVTAQIDVGHGGGPLLLGAGTLSVGAWRDREVVQIDPRSNRVVGRFPVGGQNPTGLAVDAETVWVVHPDIDEVVRLDPRTATSSPGLSSVRCRSSSRLAIAALCRRWLPSGRVRDGLLPLAVWWHASIGPATG